MSTKDFKVYTKRNVGDIKQLREISKKDLFAMKVVANVLPFRVNNYVVDELIDWGNIPDDPIYQLTFPQRGMLSDEHYERMAYLLERDADRKSVKRLAYEIHRELNPHPAGQQDMNVPELDGEALLGVQHKYRETVLFFPAQGQTCHSYCTFCFRWPQFVAEQKMRFVGRETSRLNKYLKIHPDVSDVLITGGDPMVMSGKLLKRYLESLISPDNNLQTIRIGTKSLSFWPQRYVSDSDADEILRLFEKVIKSGRHLAFMAHFNHWREFDTPVAKEAIRRIRNTGAEIRVQAPMIAHINDNSAVWKRLWRDEVRLGMIPYYMFVERDTGACRYFKVPLYRAWEIYRDAFKLVSGLGRTVRGPSMSTGPGKIEIQGVSEVHGEKVFVLRFIQARNPDWVQRPFFAAYNEEATWLPDLTPAFGEKKFFFEDEYEAMRNRA